ncbi:MAG TPA: hypothetical protein VNU71_07455 [Burkholderiaceae bacterium]|nr:hypothetical protein [Burkholderiaceae bacterium]
MRHLAALLCLAAAPAFALVPAPSDSEAQQAHAKGTCGRLGPGTGLSGDKGWVVSMLPGKHEFRVRDGAGKVYVTTARQSIVDFDAGRPYYVVIEGAGPQPQLEWRVPGSDWGLVSKYFLYPVSGQAASK